MSFNKNKVGETLFKIIKKNENSGEINYDQNYKQFLNLNKKKTAFQHKISLDSRSNWNSFKNPNKSIFYFLLKNE